MKILHIWEWAGIGSILSHYLRKLGHTSDVVKTQDFFGFLSFYNQLKYMKVDFPECALKKVTEYDVIHIHAKELMPVMIRKLFPSKKIIFSWHGSEARAKNPNKAHMLVHQYCDKVFICTKDLAKYVGNDIEWLPNICDIEHFKKRENGFGAISVHNDKGKIYRAQKYLDEGKELFGEKCEVVNRSIIFKPYENMPEFLAQYRYYYDIKFDNEKLNSQLSATAVQALSVGLIVKKWTQDGIKTITKFPEEHSPDNVIGRLMEVYEDRGNS